MRSVLTYCTTQYVRYKYIIFNLNTISLMEKTIHTHIESETLNKWPPRFFSLSFFSFCLFVAVHSTLHVPFLRNYFRLNAVQFCMRVVRKAQCSNYETKKKNRRKNEFKMTIHALSTQHQRRIKQKKEKKCKSVQFTRRPVHPIRTREQNARNAANSVAP